VTVDTIRGTSNAVTATDVTSTDVTSTDVTSTDVTSTYVVSGFSRTRASVKVRLKPDATDDEVGMRRLR
jgi:hypothetical protein